jgi:hypothetical protein
VAELLPRQARLLIAVDDPVETCLLGRLIAMIAAACPGRQLHASARQCADPAKNGA